MKGWAISPAISCIKKTTFSGGVLNIHSFNQVEDKEMSIGSINSSSSSMMMSGMKGMQRPDPSKMADQLFSKLDTKGQGYIEKGDLQAALDKVSKGGNSNNTNESTSVDDMFSTMDSDGNGKVTKEEMSATFEKMASQMDGPLPRMRLQEGHGNMPPPPPPGGGQGTQKASSTGNSRQGSDPADTNGDGKVSAQEALAYAKNQTSSSTDTSSSSNDDIHLMQMLAGGMPPPLPQDGGQVDQGFTKDQLASMSKNLNSIDSTRATVMSDVAANFDTADTNSDGKVNASEARAYEESKSASNTNNTSIANSSSTVDEKIMKQLMQLIHGYGGIEKTDESSSFSVNI